LGSNTPLVKTILKAACAGAVSSLVALLIADHVSKFGSLFEGEWLIMCVYPGSEPLLDPWGWALVTFVGVFAIAAFVLTMWPSSHRDQSRHKP
jgi:hypothetical protein